MTLTPLNEQSIEILSDFLEKAKGRRFCLFCDSGGWNCLCGRCPEGEYHDENCFAMQVQYIVDIYYEPPRRHTSKQPTILEGAESRERKSAEKEEGGEEEVHVMIVEDYKALKARVQELEDEVEDSYRVICNLQRIAGIP